MKLWSGLLSPFSAKVRIALAEKGVDAEILEVPWSRASGWGPKPPAFLEASPRGEVPVLVDGDLAVVDSTVIVEYLDDAYPKSAWLPAGAVDRARCRMLEDDADRVLAGPVTVLIQQVFNQPDPDQRDAAAVSEATKSIGETYARLENELDGREFLVGDFSPADAAAFLAVGFASALGVAPGDGHANLVAWFERVKTRPSVGREWDEMMAAAARA